MQVYAPATLIVILSWLSFWLTSKDISNRMSLGLSLVLTITLFVVTTNAGLPKVDYIKAVDVYLLGCFLFVFAVLIGM